MLFTSTRNALPVAMLALATAHLFAAPERERPEGDQVAVVATTTIVADIVAGIGGDRISLYVMLPSGTDPHVFYPTPRDLRQVADADLLFVSGAGLEADFLGNLLASVEPRRTVEVSEHLPLRRMDTEPDGHDEEGSAREHGHGEFDAHVWMDPTLVAGWTVEIAEALAEVDPAHAAEYAARAATLTRELHELDAWIRNQVSAVPAQRRVLVTDHEVLGYFADRYGFELLDTVIPGVGTASEPSARHLAQLRETIVEHEIAVIFIGTTVSPQIAESVAADLGIELVAIYTGSLSEPGGPADTYQEFMRTNVERIVAALAP